MHHPNVEPSPGSEAIRQNRLRRVTPKADLEKPLSQEESRDDRSLAETVRLLDLKPEAQLTQAEQQLLERVYEPYG